MMALLSLLNEHGQLPLGTIAARLGTSAATIRRDVAQLAAEGLLERTHGGARPVVGVTELPVHLRGGTQLAAKQAIARTVASLIPEGRHALALTGGSTTVAVLRALKGRRDLTVVTNSLSIGLAAAELDLSRVLIAGGVLRRNSLELVGPLAEATMKLVNVGTAVLGADGLTVAGGLTIHDETEARTNQLMLDRAQRVIATVDSSKLGTVTLAKVVDLADIDVLVTDDGAKASTIAEIRAAGVEVLVAGCDG